MNAQSAFARLLLQGAAAPAGLATWNGSDVAQRYGVYRNNVVVSLIEALGAAFPVVRALVGEDFFSAMARDFVRASPPQSPVLSTYGDEFPDFIALFAPAASLPYLADVARLELLRLGAYHAADADALTPADFTRLGVERLIDARVRLHPALRLLSSPYAIASMWRAHHGLRAWATVDPTTPENALVVRPLFNVEIVALTDGAFALLEILRAGETFAAAVAGAAAAEPAFGPDDALSLLMGQGLAIGFGDAQHEECAG